MALSSSPGSGTFDAPAPAPSVPETLLNTLLAQDLTPDLLTMFAVEIHENGEGEVIFSPDQSAALIESFKPLLNRALFLLRHDLVWLLGCLEEDRPTRTESVRADQLLGSSKAIMQAILDVLIFLERLGFDTTLRTQARAFFHEINGAIEVVYGGVASSDEDLLCDFDDLLGQARDRSRDYCDQLFLALDNGHPLPRQFNLLDRLKVICESGDIELHVSGRTDAALEVRALPEALRSLLENLQRGAERLAREQGIELESHLLVDAPLSLTESHVRLRFVTNLKSTPLTSDRLQKLLKESPSKGLSGGLGFYLTHQRLAASQRPDYAWTECLFLRKAFDGPGDVGFHDEDNEVLGEAGLAPTFLFEVLLDGLAVNRPAEQAEIALTLELDCMAAERASQLGGEQDEYFHELFDKAFGAVLILLDEHREPDVSATDEVRELFTRVRRRLSMVPL